MKYATYLPLDKRRETFSETAVRNNRVHIKKYGHISGAKDLINSAFDQVISRKVLPSMRSMQNGGWPIDRNPVKMYNCSYAHINDWRSFQEAMFLMLSGCGFGFSVQGHHVGKLPTVKGVDRSKRERRYLVDDSIEGWADAIKVLIKSYLFSTAPVRFDYSNIRKKGTPISSGGKAPGHAPLREACVKIENLLMNIEEGDRLEDWQVADILCFIAEAVYSGGVRRAAMICLFDRDSDAMLAYKSGAWWEKNSHRRMVNISAVLPRQDVTFDEFRHVFEKTRLSQAGEPGIYLTNDVEYGTNPCAEISLENMGFCNLVEISASNIKDEVDFERRVWAAAVIATLQAGFTDFHYLRPEWRENAERDALIGVSFTGIADGDIDKYSLEYGAEVVKATNIEVAKMIGINPAKRTTCVKPAGTTSLIFGSSSGIHAWHSEYYIRRLRVEKSEAIYQYLSIYHPELIEDEVFDPKKMAVIQVPQKAPDGAITRDESAIDLLERVKKFSLEWIRNGHVEGVNSHNVSATISVRNDEWDDVLNWMWSNRYHYNGLSVLPFDGGTYQQAPFETITKERFEELEASLSDVDLTKVVELEDVVNFSETQACGGGGCELK